MKSIEPLVWLAAAIAIIYLVNLIGDHSCAATCNGAESNYSFNSGECYCKVDNEWKINFWGGK